MVTTGIENVEDEYSCILNSMRLCRQRRVRRTSHAEEVYNRVPG